MLSPCKPSGHWGNRCTSDDGLSTTSKAFNLFVEAKTISFTFIFMARVLCIDSYNFHLRLTTSSTSHKLSSLQLSSCCFYLNYKHPEFSTSTFRCLTHLEADGRMKSISLHHLYQLQGTISGGIGLALPLQLRLKSAIIFSAVYMSSEST